MDTSPMAGAAEEDLSGRKLGGYRLVRRLGSGAMADVYLAEQISLGRHVAIKVLRPETLRHPAAVSRFEQEARAAASLVHGHIVQIHEVACLDGVHVLAEEYVAGPSLRTWLEARGPLDPRQALAVLAQVGSAPALSMAALTSGCAATRSSACSSLCCTGALKPAGAAKPNQANT
jgi:serine/threonine-protein kinase